MGQLRTRKRGKTWEWSFEGARVNGKRQSFSKSGYKTKSAAIEAGTQAKAEYDNAGRVFTPSEISLSDYLDYWLENYVKKNLAHNSYLDYERKVRIHIKPSLGRYRLSSIEADIIQLWVDDFKTKGLSASMIRNTLACLSGALNYAVVPLKYIKYNPCEYVKLTKLSENPLLREKREYICSNEDWDKIISRFPEKNIFHIALMAGYHLGTRIGETYGIDLLSDVDFDKNTIKIRHQMQKENKNWIYKNPKYDSFRTLDMDNVFRTLLKREIRYRKEKMLFYGHYYKKTYLTSDSVIIQVPADVSVPYKEIMPLCVRENGELLTPESFKYCSRVIHNELNIPLFHNHSLRHTHGTILAENGAAPKTVMDRLGHKDISITMNRYIFNTEKMRQDAVRIFEEAIS